MTIIIVIVMEHGLFLTMGLCRFCLHVCYMLDLDLFKEKGFLKWLLKLWKLPIKWGLWRKFKEHGKRKDVGSLCKGHIWATVIIIVLIVWISYCLVKVIETIFKITKSRNQILSCFTKLNNFKAKSCCIKKLVYPNFNTNRKRFLVTWRNLFPLVVGSKH
jgi:hypothetical protein